jgi:hypothetical protein
MMIRLKKKLLVALCVGGSVFQFGGCFPDYYFQNLLASSISEVVSVILTDTLNVLLPPPDVSR